MFKQQLDVAADHLIPGFAINGGFKFERKELTQNYDIPGYWGAFSSTVPANEPGPYGFGVGIGHSRDATYTPPPLPNSGGLRSINCLKWVASTSWTPKVRKTRIMFDRHN